MRIIYVTASMPYGPAETFIIDEIGELLLRHEVLIVPRSPGALGKHAARLAPFTRSESLFSPKVLATAVGAFIRRPAQVAVAALRLMRTGSLRTALRNLAILPKALWMTKVASDWRADHIHCHWAGTTASMAFIASELSGVKWSMTTHRSDIVGNNLLRQKAKSTTMTRVISRDGFDMLVARGVDPDSKLRILPMGVRIPCQPNFHVPRMPVVLCPADLLEVKGHRHLIEAWRIVRGRGIRAKLWLAGEGNLRRDLTKMVNCLRLADSVRFMGTVTHDELLGAYAAGKISAVVLASVDLGNGCHEGIPVALVEAMSYAVPVIGTRTGGIPELLVPGVGLLIPPEDPDAIADAIESLLGDDALSRKLGESGRNHIIRTRDVAAIVAELEACFADAPPCLAATTSRTTAENIGDLHPQAESCE